MDVSGISGGGVGEGLLIKQQKLQAQQLQNHENKIRAIDNKINAYNEVDSKRRALYDALKKIDAPETIAARALQLNDPETKVGSVTVAPKSALGEYTFEITELASASKITNSGRLANPLYSASISTTTADTGPLLSALKLPSLTEGNLTLQVGRPGTPQAASYTLNVNFADTLQDFCQQIEMVTNGDVKLSYDGATDKFSLESVNGKDLILGAPGNTSNFFELAHLFSKKNPSSDPTASFSTASEVPLGTVQVTSLIKDSQLAAGNVTSGTLKINGVEIPYDVEKDSLTALMYRVSGSKANATLSYNPSLDQFTLLNSKTGALGIEISDTGTLLQALKLNATDSVFALGKNAQFKVNGGPLLSSTDNEIQSAQHNIEGVAITFKEKGTLSFNIKPDAAPAEKALQNFVEAYNNFMTFVSSKTKITKNDKKPTAGILSDDRDLKNLTSSLRLLALGTLDTPNQTIKGLANLGISTSKTVSDPQLSLDAAKLKQEIENNPKEVLEAVKAASKVLIEPIEPYVNRYLRKVPGEVDKTPQQRLTENKNRIQAQQTKVQQEIDALKKKYAQDEMKAQMAFENSQRQIASLTSFNR